jgi:Zn-dependent protease
MLGAKTLLYTETQLSQVQQFLLVIISLIISITVHEFFHAWMANYLGDPTPKMMGRVTLNPLAHLDPLGSVMMLLSAWSGMGFGWGKPVPVNPYRTGHDPVTAHGIIGVSGPFSNLAMAAIAAAPLRFGNLPPGLIQAFFVLFCYTNIGLALFNLLPIPPLDGYSVLLAILNRIRTPWAASWFRSLARLEPQGPMILMAIFMLDSLLPRFSILGTLLNPPMRFLSQLLLG